MKKWIGRNRDLLTKMKIILILILLVAVAIFIISILIFPQWKDKPHGLMILAAAIGLGILLKLNDILSIVDKWFVKKDKYLLSNDQKEVLEWMINKVKENKLDTEFEFAYLVGGIVFSRAFENFDESEKIKITKGTMEILNDSGLIIIKPTTKFNNSHCVIHKEKAIQAINSNYKN